MALRSIWSIGKRIVKSFVEDDPLHLAAALAFYTLLTLAPLLLIVVAVAGLAFGRDAVVGRIATEISGLVGESGGELVQTVVANAWSPRQSVVSLVVGIVTLLFGATTVFLELQGALNRVWDVTSSPKKEGGIVSFIRHRLLSLAMVLGVGFLLLVSLVLSAGISAASGYLGGPEAKESMVWQVVNQVVSFGLITVLFAMIYRFLPDRRLEWRDVRLGALLTAALFTVGKYGIGVYLGNASLDSTYGAAGSAVVLMAWVYYASTIFLLGAETTRVLTEDREEAGARMTPRAA